MRLIPQRAMAPMLQVVLLATPKRVKTHSLAWHREPNLVWECFLTAPHFRTSPDSYMTLHTDVVLRQRMGKLPLCPCFQIAQKVMSLATDTGQQHIQAKCSMEEQEAVQLLAMQKLEKLITNDQNYLPGPAFFDLGRNASELRAPAELGRGIFIHALMAGAHIFSNSWGEQVIYFKVHFRVQFRRPLHVVTQNDSLIFTSPELFVHLCVKEKHHQITLLAVNCFWTCQRELMLFKCFSLPFV